MRAYRHIPLLLSCLLSCLVLTLSTLAEEPVAKGPLTVGKVHFGQSAAKVQAAIGAPESKGKKFGEAATGLTLQEWKYPQMGLTVEMAEYDAGPQTVNRITATKPCKLKWFGEARVGMTQGELLMLMGRAEMKHGSESQFSDSGFLGIFWPKEYVVMSFEMVDRKVSKLYIVPGPE